MSNSYRLVVAGVFLGVATSLWAAPTTKIGHDPLTCVPARASARVVASIKLPDSLTSARVYFRQEGQASEYFLEMRRGDLDRYWAVLPAADSAEGFVVYRIVARDGSGNSVSTPSARAAISSTCAVSLSAEELRAARNIVLGLTAVDQNQNPAGFGCEGIVAMISPSGEFRSVTPCAAVAGAVPAGKRTSDPAAITSQTAPSSGMQSTTAATCANPDGLTPGPRPPTPTPTRPPLSFSRPNPSPN